MWEVKKDSVRIRKLKSISNYKKGLLKSLEKCNWHGGALHRKPVAGKILGIGLITADILFTNRDK